MNQQMLDKFLSANPRARRSLDEMNRRAAGRMAELDAEREAEQREAERRLDEVRAHGRAYFDEQERVNRQAAEAAKAEAEAAARAKVEDEVRRAFLQTGGMAEEWERERDGFLAEDRKRRALQAMESDRRSWREHVRRAASVPPGGG